MFLNKYENGKTVMEGLCLKCASTMNIPGFDDMVKNMGISKDELEHMVDQLSEAIEDMPDDLNELFEQGGAMSMPLDEKMFGALQLGGDQDDESDEDGDDLPTLMQRLEAQFNGGGEKKEMAVPPNDGNDRNKKNPHPKRPKLKFLDNFCTNLNTKVSEGKIDTIVGRDNEIERIVQILNRRSKNNPCLIGEAGVGKTAIAEGIASRIVAGDVPARLIDKEVYLLDLTGLLAGTQFRGQFESRIKGLLDDVKKVGNAILFIDEVHSIVGAGDNHDGAMGASNMLKPALSRGEIQIIGATTFNEYRQYIEKDVALERRFQTVKVGEPSIEEATEIILGIKKHYEEYHRVVVSEDTARRMVVLSERYINNRYLPDKAIDLLDEACSCAVIDNKELDQYDKLVREKVAVEKNIRRIESMPEVDYEKHGEAKIRLAQIDEKITQLEPMALGVEVTDRDIAKVIELWTGVPAKNISESEMEKMDKLVEVLSEKVVGQTEAVELIAAAVRRTRVRFDKVKRPASFIFVGPTGVGKTELVKVLSEEIFDNVEPLIRVDMSEYMEEHSISKLIGAPPGYKGSEDGGQLTERVRRRPYSVVLFDEIEKAHRNVMNILLQIMDEGHVHDAQGRDVSFENTIIIMTSNAGSATTGGAVGFNKTEEEKSSAKAMKGLRDFLRPEFLARVDEVVTFKALSKEDFAGIAKLRLDIMKEAVKEYDVLFSFTDEVLDVIAEKSHGSKKGAREIRSQIRTHIEDPLSTLVANRTRQPVSLVAAVVEDGKIKLETA